MGRKMVTDIKPPRVVSNLPNTTLHWQQITGAYYSQHQQNVQNKISFKPTQDYFLMI